MESRQRGPIGTVLTPLLILLGHQVNLPGHITLILDKIAQLTFPIQLQDPTLLHFAFDDLFHTPQMHPSLRQANRIWARCTLRIHLTNREQTRMALLSQMGCRYTETKDLLCKISRT